MGNMARKRMEYLKRKHKKEGDIRLDNAKMLALLSELAVEESSEELRKEGFSMIRFLKMFWRWIQWKLSYFDIFQIRGWGIYCPRCGACGEGWIEEDGSTGGCCSPLLCDHGIFCARYYD